MAAEPSAACIRVRADSAEIALGILTGPERAGALSHLAECHECRRLVDDLAHMGDGILVLSPAVEPRIGFEGRVQERIRAAIDGSPPPRPLAVVRVEGEGRRRHLAPILTTAAVAVLMAAAGVAAGMALNGSAPDTRAGVVTIAYGQATCRVLVHGDSPAWLFVDLQAPPGWSGSYRVEVVGESGTAEPVGDLTLTSGHGVLATTLAGRVAGDIAVVRVTAEGGTRYEVPLT